MSEAPNQRTLVVIPAYNAAAYLPELLARCRAAVPALPVLVVDDGSTDSTTPVARQERALVLGHGHNRGKGAALKSGFAYAQAHGFRAVITLDADLQHPPEAIPDFLAAADGRTMLLGTRNTLSANMPIHRRLSNTMTSCLISVFAGLPIRDSQTGFRLIPMALLRSVELRADGYQLESELLLKAGAIGWPIAGVPVETIYHGGPSHIRPLVDTGRFIGQLWRRIWL
jgi:glycosyltransferase involved in cell wall biosynthesis